MKRFRCCASFSVTLWPLEASMDTLLRRSARLAVRSYTEVPTSTTVPTIGRVSSKRPQAQQGQRDEALSRPRSDSASIATSSLEPMKLPTAKPQTKKFPAEQKQKKLPKLKMPSEATTEREESLWRLGYHSICGVDEAGRGPLAGPVVAAACVIPEGVSIEGLRDSKKLSEMQRERLFEQLTADSRISYAIDVVEAEEIDRINILQAALVAMSRSVQKLQASEKNLTVDYVLVDGNRLPADLPPSCKAEFIIKGDLSCRVIAAASILAKVTRDRLMLDYDKRFPEYGFKNHKGYGTGKHMAALLSHGPSPIHRRTFAPLKDWSSMATQPKRTE